jgi:hypothetical protein
VASFGQEKTMQQAETSSITIKGYVVDYMCARGMAGKANTMKLAANHTKACALHDGCAASEFGVFSDGKWYKFDKDGDVKALALVRNSSTEKGITVEVKGTMSGQTLIVGSIQEAREEQSNKRKIEESRVVE